MTRFLPLGLASLLAVNAFGAGIDVASATNQLGLDLYGRLAAKTPEGNLALSPYSLESALALALAGADGATRAEMARTMHLPPDDAALGRAFGELRATLASATSNFDEWHEADRLFGQTGYAFRPSFLTLLDEEYGAPFTPLDFKTAAEHARSTINDWVGEQTHQRIKEVIPGGGVNDRTRLVLVDALYMKARWVNPFAEESTRDLPFWVNGAASQRVPTMRTENEFGYLREKDTTVLTLPYEGTDIQFLILLPDARNGVGALAAKLTSATLKRYAQAKPRSLTLYLPKYRMEGDAMALGEELRGLGMKTAFDQPQGTANFDRIAPRTPNDYLALSEVFQKVFVDLDEKGTEAAAGTGVVVLQTFAVEAHPHPLVVRVDHPFLFAIQHRETGLCLFLGRIGDPRQ